MSVLLQDGAVANLPSLDGLLAMVSKKGGEAVGWDCVQWAGWCLESRECCTCRTDLPSPKE